MRRVSVMNQKGGVGKTTTTANLGAALANAGWRVLLIDLDPQSHLTMHFSTQVDAERATIYDVLTGGCDVREALWNVRERVTLVPSTVDLAAAETELAGMNGRQVVLRDALSPIAADFDVMMIDCPPSVGLLTVNALAATFEVLIPLQPQFLPLQGLAKLHETITLVHRRVNPGLRISGIVICMHDAGTRLAGEVIDDLEQFLDTFRAAGAAWSDARLFSTRIRRNIKLAESPSHGLTIFDYEPNSNGARDYAALAHEVFGVCEASAFPPIHEPSHHEPSHDRQGLLPEPQASACANLAAPSSRDLQGAVDAPEPSHDRQGVLPAPTHDRQGVLPKPPHDHDASDAPGAREGLAADGRILIAGQAAADAAETAWASACDSRPSNGRVVQEASAPQEHVSAPVEPVPSPTKPPPPPENVPAEQPAPPPARDADDMTFALVAAPASSNAADRSGVIAAALSGDEPRSAVMAAESPSANAAPASPAPPKPRVIRII